MVAARTSTHVGEAVNIVASTASPKDSHERRRMARSITSGITGAQAEGSLSVPCIRSTPCDSLTSSR